MAISPEQLERFIKLYSNEYGVILSEEKAISEINKLAQLYRAVYRNKQGNTV